MISSDEEELSSQNKCCDSQCTSQGAYTDSNVKLFYSKKCGHCICEACWERNRKRNQGNVRCPYPNCPHIMTTQDKSDKTHFERQMERELLLRKRWSERINVVESDFGSARPDSLNKYNNFLEEVEDLIFNLLDDDASTETKELSERKLNELASKWEKQTDYNNSKRLENEQDTKAHMTSEVFGIYVPREVEQDDGGLAGMFKFALPSLPLATLAVVKTEKEIRDWERRREGTLGRELRVNEWPHCEIRRLAMMKGDFKEPDIPKDLDVTATKAGGFNVVFSTFMYSAALTTSIGMKRKKS